MKQRRVGSSLDDYKLEYEEMEFKKVGKVKETSRVKATAKTTSVSAVKTKKPAKASLKTRAIAKFKLLRNKLDNVVNKVRNPSKKVKKTTKIQQKLAKQQRTHAILGIWLLFVVVSIIYSTYVVRTFVNSTASLFALAPQVIFAGCTLVKAFSKIYK